MGRKRARQMVVYVSGNLTYEWEPKCFLNVLLLRIVAISSTHLTFCSYEFLRLGNSKFSAAKAGRLSNSSLIWRFSRALTFAWVQLIKHIFEGQLILHHTKLTHTFESTHVVSAFQCVDITLYLNELLLHLFQHSFDLFSRWSSVK